MNRRIYKLRIMHRMPLVLATALLTSVSVFAQTKIRTEEQLKAIANNLSGKYVLENDITLSGDEWTPIGTSDHPFTGKLDGQGHTIIGLTVGNGVQNQTNNNIFSYNIAYGTVTAPKNGAGGITGMVDNDGNTEYKSNISAAPYIKGHADHTRGINGWCNNNCSNTNSGGNLSWAGTEYYLGGTKTDANKINDGNGIHGTVTTTEDLKKVTTYTDLGFNTNTWELTECQSPRLKMFPNISDAVSISGLPDIITKGQTVTVTATSALNRPIEIISSDNSIISVKNNTLKAENYGTCNITFAASAGDFVQAASKTFTITVPGLQVTYHIGDNSDAVTSEVSTEGSLATLLGGEDNAMKVTQLSVKGYLDGTDISLLQKMAGSEGTGKLKSLNLSEATFMSTGKKVPDNIFQNCKNLQQVDLSGMTAIGIQAFKNCAFTEFSIPASVTKIENCAFAGNSALKKVIVHSAQIDARSYDGEDNIFYDMEPNDVQVVFVGAAEDHYKNYRNDIKDGNNVYKNAFMYLLTKTLDENSTDYTVVPQRHADVRLKRTFKEGWNTLVLPFGARYLAGDTETAGCARIFQKALNVSGDDSFMIAAYRGLAKNKANPDNSTFYFLKYANYDTDPLDECEPLLIRMTQRDIEKAEGVYTFKNVELNYDGDNNTTYTADEVIARMGKKENGNYFDGNYNHDANDKFGKCTYDDFYFMGTLYKQTGIATEGSAFIAPGDYIIQNNTFVKCFSNKTYGLKGFRGYFKQLPSSTSPAKGNIGICLVDRNGVVSSIHQVDGASLTSASVAPVAVYNLSGQQVGNSLSTLAKGVYIVKGKKFVKK